MNRIMLILCLAIIQRSEEMKNLLIVNLILYIYICTHVNHSDVGYVCMHWIQDVVSNTSMYEEEDQQSKIIF